MPRFPLRLCTWLASLGFVLQCSPAGKSKPVPSPTHSEPTGSSFIANPASVFAIAFCKTLTPQTCTTLNLTDEKGGAFAMVGTLAGGSVGEWSLYGMASDACEKNANHTQFLLKAQAFAKRNGPTKSHDGQSYCVKEGGAYSEGKTAEGKTIPLCELPNRVIVDADAWAAGGASARGKALAAVLEQALSAKTCEALK